MLCKDGIVLASDGMESHNLGGTNFVGFDNLKTHIINNALIVSLAGSGKVMQDFITYLQQQNHININDICGGFMKYYFNTFNTYPQEIRNVFISDIANKISQGQFDFNALIGIKNGLEYELYSIGGNMQLQKKRKECVWYEIIGSGVLIGKPSIRLIQKILNIKEIPTVDEAVNFAYWVIQHAIDVSSCGIGGNITIAQIKNNENTQVIDISSAKEYIQNMYDYIHQFGKTAKEIQDIEIAPTL